MTDKQIEEYEQHVEDVDEASHRLTIALDILTDRQIDEFNRQM